MADFKLSTSIRYDPILLDAPKHEDLDTTDWNRKVASPWYMLDYHRDRMLKAATHFGWKPAVEKIEGLEGLKRLEDFLTPFTRSAGLKPHRVKILLDEDGTLKHEFSPAQQTSLNNMFPSYLPAPEEAKEAAVNISARATPGKLPEYEIYVDSAATSHTEFTHYKTTKRQMYDDARKRLHLALADPKEVLLVNPTDGSIMEGSFTTPFFWRNNRWVTPPVSQGFQEGNGSGGNEGTTRRWALERGLAIEEKVMARSLQNGEECWISNGVRGFIFGRIKI
ncbi:Aminodeoxychorismate lyase [Seiridium cupressi]